MMAGRDPVREVLELVKLPNWRNSHQIKAYVNGSTLDRFRDGNKERHLPLLSLKVQLSLLYGTSAK
jgi:hypothetical protein